MRVVAFACATSLFSFSLYGCGGGDNNDTGSDGDKSSTTAVATIVTTTTSTSTTTTFPCPQFSADKITLPEGVRDGQKVADIMNAEFYGYKEGDPTSPFGTYLRIASDIKFFCNSGCYHGNADCVISGSVFNSKQMIDPQSGSPGGWYGYKNGRGMAAWYVNSTLVTTKLAKCSYAWDGGTMQKLNNGCGCQQGQGGDDACDHPDSPYFNKCNPPEYTENCTGESDQVKKCWCGNGRIPMGEMPKDGKYGSRCFWKGAAFDASSGEDSEDETHTMLDWRVNHTANNSSTADGPAMKIWNEMVLDGHRFGEALQTDPAGVVLAMVWAGDDEEAVDGLPVAQKMASAFQEEYNLDKPLPVIRMVQTVDARKCSGNVFVFQGNDQSAMSAMV